MTEYNAEDFLVWLWLKTFFLCRNNRVMWALSIWIMILFPSLSPQQWILNETIKM